MPLRDRTTPFSQAMRKAGYVPLPRLWVKKKDMPLIHEIAHPYMDEVNSMRAKFKDSKTAHNIDEAPEASPVDDKEAAWAAFERMRSGG